LQQHVTDFAVLQASDFSVVEATDFSVIGAFELGDGRVLVVEYLSGFFGFWCGGFGGWVAGVDDYGVWITRASDTLLHLPPYHVYLRMTIDGVMVRGFSGRTFLTTD